MIKTILTLAMAVAVGFAGINLAEARWGGDWMMGNGGGYGPSACNGPGGWKGQTTVSYEAMEKFHTETSDLRKQMHEKRSEYYDAINAENPDKELAKELWSQLFDLQNEMHQKATDAGMQPGNGRRGRF